MSSDKKIILIGPVYPYKGGISHYTGLMCRALSSRYRVTMLSYKLQYPRFLFRKEQRDYSNDLFQIPEAEYRINTANPWNWITTALYIKKQKPDYMILQWWHPYFSPCYIALSLLTPSVKKLFICHNVLPHERFPFDRLLAKSALRHGSGYILHSEQDRNDLLSMLPDAVYEVTPHPSYSVFRFKSPSLQDARAHLNLPSNKKILLFFGLVREYKGLKYLLESMPAILEALPDIHLVIAGDFGTSYPEYRPLIEQIAPDHCISIINRYIPDIDVEYYFSACDMVVLPYESATQSGIVQIAYGFEKPVVVTNVGGLPEVVTDGMTGYVIPPRDPQTIADAVIHFFTENKSAEYSENIKKESSRFSWEHMVEKIQALLS